jgi:hypothetical protein
VSATGERSDGDRDRDRGHGRAQGNRDDDPARADEHSYAEAAQGADERGAAEAGQQHQAAHPEHRACPGTRR